MPPLSSQRGQPPPSGGPARGEPQPGSLRGGGRGGLFDSPEREPPAARRTAASLPTEDRGRPLRGGSNDALDPAGDGRGGLAGLRDPYDRPTRSQLRGAQSRLRQDKASGALDDAAGRYRVLFGGHQAVRKGLRRSIADAYVAYVGTVVKLPEDSYGLALRALDRTFNGSAVGPGLPPGGIDDHLGASPFATSRAKHAQIFNTAHRIMRDLGGYVYDVSYYCPGELDELREMRRPGGGATRSGESYKAGPRQGAGEPAPGREAVRVARRPASAGPTPARPRGQRPLTGPPNAAVSPITGAIRQSAPAPDELGSRRTPPSAAPRPPPQRRPATAPGSGSRAGSAQAAARSMATVLDTAAEAEAVERDGGGGRGGRRPDLMDPLEDRQMRNLRRLSSPAMFAKTPPHLRVSKFYDHTSPTQEMMELIRRKTLRAAQEQMERAEEEQAAAAAAAAAAASDAAAGATGGGADGDPSSSAAYVPRRHASRDGPPKMSRYNGVAAAANVVRHPVDTSPQHASPGRGGSPGISYRHGSQDPIPDRDPDPAGTERILWIIETAYELGLAEVLGLEGPPPYPRSERLHPRDHRRQFYEALYSSPERYGPYVPYSPPYIDMGGMLGPVAPAAGAAPPAGPGVGAGGWYGDATGGYYGRHASPGANGGGGGGSAWRYEYEYDGRTAQRLEVAAARRHVREGATAPAAKMYPRSQRLSRH